jgi:hypothetical protein
MGVTLRRPCRCGHGKDAHEHYRSGADCSACQCARFHGQVEVTVRFGRVRPVQQVVLPDEAYVAETPAVRWTHSAGLTPGPEPVSPLVSLVRPRTTEDAVAPRRLQPRA